MGNIPVGVFISLPLLTAGNSRTANQPTAKMCLVIIITHTSCGCRIIRPKDCPEFKRKITEGEERYRQWHPVHSHDKDGVSRAPALSPEECPLYYEENESTEMPCIFCLPKAKSGVRLTKELDELETRMAAKMEAARRNGKGWLFDVFFGGERCVHVVYPNGTYHNLY
jgi:hypothetical protein